MMAKGAWGTIFRRRYLPQLVMTIALPIFNQFDGINSIMFLRAPGVLMVQDYVEGVYEQEPGLQSLLSVYVRGRGGQQLGGLNRTRGVSKHACLHFN